MCWAYQGPSNGMGFCEREDGRLWGHIRGLAQTSDCPGDGTHQAEHRGGPRTSTMKKQFKGTLDVWAILPAQKPCYPEEAHYLAPAPTGWPARTGDILDAARACLLELNWSIDDARAACPASRRTWDVSISTALMAHADENRQREGLDSLLSHHRSGTTRKQF